MFYWLLQLVLAETLTDRLSKSMSTCPQPGAAQRCIRSRPPARTTSIIDIANSTVNCTTFCRSSVAWMCQSNGVVPDQLRQRVPLAQQRVDQLDGVRFVGVPEGGEPVAQGPDAVQFGGVAGAAAAPLPPPQNSSRSLSVVSVSGGGC